MQVTKLEPGVQYVDHDTTRYASPEHGIKGPGWYYVDEKLQAHGPVLSRHMATAREAASKSRGSR